MNVQKMLADLYQEKRRIDDAIVALERLAATGKRRRGRPPKWLAEARKRTQSRREPQDDHESG